MKKISLVLLSLVICFTLFAFVGCGENTTGNAIDLASLTEGAELSVYPECEFDYKYVKGNNEYAFHISSISAKLTKKNSIKAGDVIEDNFYRYEITLTASGYTDASLTGQDFYLSLSTGYTGMTVVCYIDNDGKFNGSKVIGFNNQNLPQLTFWNLSSLG